jgi:outer membrane lipoprotein-sorting protein
MIVLPLLLTLSGTAHARRAKLKIPPAEEVLHQALEAEPPAYEGRVTVETFLPKLSPPKEVHVRFARPGRYRRETLDDSGQPVQLVVSDGKTEWIYDRARKRVWTGAPPEPDYKQLDDSDLLEENYEASVSTGEPVAKRQTWLLELRSREEGKTTRRLWVDRKSGVVLRDQAFGLDGALSSETRFEEVHYPRKPKDSWFTFSPPSGVTIVKRVEPDYMALGEAKSASGLDPKTPVWLPSGYVFESLNVLPRGGKNIIHYRYSDGINVLSLFQCPPRVALDFGAKGGERVLLAQGHGTLAATPEGRVLGWSAGDSKFVLVGPVAPETLKRIAESIR